MKKTFILIAAMYAHIVLSISVIVAVILLCKQPPEVNWLLIMLYCIAVVGIQIYGWVVAVMAFEIYGRNDYNTLGRCFKALKLYTIPFYVINYIFSFAIWFVIVAASRGIFIIFVWIPVAFTCAFIIQSGIYGYLYIKYLRKNYYGVMDINACHSLFQFIPVLDVVSTVIILGKLKKMGRKIDGKKRRKDKCVQSA